ncbi:nucleotide sugar dehydrogenase [Asinibacterium sp. OR53]|uniref:nucleotide sugar dehydrogenase n=1 Tax=Asinibacterium sp. OR53 TaxID=925409 RepID=UPI0004B9275C|nr:nucleotide sugar dehydrogenase [Asinibacterium sp. OR53]
MSVPESMISRYQIAVVGLGYVGLPLAVAFGRHYRVLGFDTNEERVKELSKGIDKTKELTPEDIQAAVHIGFSSQLQAIADCNVFIITVPTPLDAHKRPNLSYLLKASKMVGSVLKKGDIVIYESTVYAGCTEEDCVPVLERASGLRYNTDFFCGYSPERINPGDRVHTVTTIKKVTSGSTPAVAAEIDVLYASIITAGTHLAPSIKVAEASKAIENAQRDVNISFMNELAFIFDRMDIDTYDVLAAAKTKWNFLPFRPGLVGGHCIGVDPHYLAHKAQVLGYQPKVILSGREVNDQMGVFVAEKLIALLAAKKQGRLQGCRVLILGITFKENCSDTRNTKVVDIYQTLVTAGLIVAVYDPWVGQMEGIHMVGELTYNYDAVILAVAHQQFREIDFSRFKQQGALIFDAQGFIERDLVDERL